ncbi:hypothetical protein HYS92_01960 [Candidatus Daviesbacteria bacterium]|nr:hypothetical protein [Candidatus Daviesbacteria bacterium]
MKTVDLNKLYWLIPIALFLLQTVFTFHSLGQIRYEELNESILTTLFFDERMVRNGVHTSIGWYSLLLITFKLFGFSLQTVKVVRLVFYLVSLVCLAILLKKLFPTWKAILILLIVGLSPSLLFFNTLALSHGFDLLILPIVLLLLYLLDFRKQKTALMISFAIFALSIFASMVYPSFMLYLPSLVIFYLWKLKAYYQMSSRAPKGRGDLDYDSIKIATSVASLLPRNDKKGFMGKVWLHLAVSAVAFLLPLILGFLYVQNRSILIVDREWGNAGIFRSFGLNSLNISAENFATGWIELLRDLFVDSTSSYHFEPNKVEFSDVYPLFGLILLTFTLWQFWPQIKDKWLFVGLPVLEIIISLAVISISTGGVRRATPLLVSIYFLMAVVVYFIGRVKGKKFWVQLVGYFAVFLILGHHLIAYPINLSHIKDPSRFKIEAWSEDGETPQQMIDRLADVAKKQDLYFDCRQLGPGSQCWYDLIYAAVESSCRFNHLNCHKIYGYSFRENRFKEITVEELGRVERLGNVGEVGYF